MGLAYVDAAMPRPTHEEPFAETARHPADGKLMVFVDEGVFRFGRDDQMVWLPPFWIDANLVTNAEYVAFVNATGHSPPSH
jgi:formylglycine-generating enzyme required for sulfatase activity